MSQDQRAVWERYVASWKAESAEQKSALYEMSLRPDCVYTDPLVQAKGWAALLAYMLDFHKQIPGGHFVTEAFTSHHGRSLASWTMRSADGTTIGTGTSYAEYDSSDRLISMTGFFEAAAEGA
jgi:hypothetical protein